MTTGLPLIIYGQITESSSGVNAITVKIRNESTNDVASFETNSNGLYIADLSDSNNYPKGYAVGQKITVYTIYSNFEGRETFTISSLVYGYEKSIALSAVTDSELIDYCTVQQVYNELDGKTASDIATDRIIDSIRWAEGLIDSKTGTSFKSITVTDEVHAVSRYKIETSDTFLDTIGQPSIGRTDYGYGGAVMNRVKADFGPIVSITSLSTNSGGFNAADSWTVRTEQTGSGGDYFVSDADAREIDFVANYPRFGDRSWKLTYVYGYDRTSTDRRVTSLLKAVERLTIILATKSIITTKTTGAMFDSTRDVKIGAIEVKAGASSGGQYLRSVEPEINELWKQIGDLHVEVI